MDDNTKWINCFNVKFEEFLKDLIETFPNDKDFKLCKQSYNLLKIVDYRKPIMMFNIYGQKYKAPIEKRDDAFFLTHDFKEELDQEENFSTDLLIKLKSYWRTMTDDNKTVIWQYLELLYKINDKVSF
jgi:hypothetical protein